MPQIPQYNTQAGIQVKKLTEEAPAIRLSAEGLTQSARAMSQFGVTISNIAEDIAKVKADQEYAKAKIEGYKVLSQIETEGAQDGDFQNFEPKYAKKIKDTQESISKTIRSPQAKQAFEQDFELKSTYSFHDIMTDGRKRFIAYDKDLMVQEVATAKERYYSASTSGEKQNAKDELGQIFSRRVENKILNKPEAANLHQKEVASLDEGQAEHDILGNPSYALGELQKGAQGIYKNLIQDKRVDLIKQAESRVEKIKSQEEEAVAIAINQKESDLIDGKIAGTINEQQVKAERQAGTITASFANSMINALRSPKTVKAKTDSSTFNKIAEDILDISKKTEDIKNNLLRKNATGELSDKDFQILYTFNQNITKETIDKTMPKRTWLQRLRNNGQDKGFREEIKTDMFKQYMQRISQGEEPAKAVSEITSAYLDYHLVEQAKHSNRHYLMNPQTKQRIYSDDGGTTWHDEKTGKEVK